MLDIKGWVIDCCIKTEIWNTIPRNDSYVYPCPAPILHPQLLEIANDIAATVEKKKDIDMTVTYIILRHNLWCTTLVFNIQRIEFLEERGVLVQRLKAGKKEEKEQESRNGKWWFHLQF